MSGACSKHIWSMFGGCSGRCMFGARSGYTWSMSGACLRHVWRMRGAMHVWSTFGARLKHA
eukprot:2098404-Lingulodinium_polyedra.AAC.1